MTFTAPLSPRHLLITALLLGSSIWSGCASLGDAKLSLASVAALSPAPVATTSAAGALDARQFVATHPGAEIALGTGDSMLPFYKNNTLLAVTKLPIAQLKPGMTVVFKSAEGWPVAHAVVEKTSDGWVTQGLHNAQADAMVMTEQNYVGVVARAYQLDVNPMFALAQSLSSHSRNNVAMLAGGLEVR